jgi:hypothetical protein
MYLQCDTIETPDPFPAEGAPSKVRPLRFFEMGMRSSILHFMLV